MIKVLFQDKRIFLVPDAKAFLINQHIKNAFVQFNADSQGLHTLIDQLLISDFENAIVEGDPISLVALFNEVFVPITACGGVVVNPDNEILFIHRRGKWDLPKGKLDEGETIEECAVREVMEETGVANVEIVDSMLTTFHIYAEGGNYIFKTTHWFEMFSADKVLSPQREEGITKAVWIHKHNVGLPLNKTYESIRDIFQYMEK